MSGFDQDSFGYGGYRAEVPVALPADLPLPPIYGPLRLLLHTAPPGHAFDQPPARQSVRLAQGATTRVAIAAGPGSESVVPYALFNQMLIRMERLERENDLLMRVVAELNDVIEQERGNQLQTYQHPTVATVTGQAEVPPVAEPGSPISVDEQVPPWRLRK